MRQTILLMVEHNGEQINDSSLRLCKNAFRLARKLNSEISAVAFGSCRQGTLDPLKDYGIQKVFLVPGELREFYSPEPRIAALLKVVKIEPPKLILLPCTLQGRQIGPFVSLKLDAGYCCRSL